MSEAEDLLREHWEAIEAGDYDRLRDLLHPDCELILSGLVIRGRDNFVKVMRAQGEAMKESFSYLKYEIRDFVHAGNTVVCENRVTGTHDKSLRAQQLDIKPTGRQVVIDGCDFVKLEDGKVKSWHAYTDGLTGLTQLGLITPKQEFDPEVMLGLKPTAG